MITKYHHYFLLENSPWPLIISVNSFNLLFSLLCFFKYGEYYNMFMNLMNISLCSFTWWLFYSGEFSLEGKNSKILESGIKFSMLLFISSEVFFFLSFFWAYFHFYLSPTMETGLTWPPLYVEMFNFLNVPLINTLILVSSGVTITISHYFLLKKMSKKSSFFLLVTIFLGVLFSMCQVMEYNSSFFSISDSTFGTSFFMLTGFHGIHVLIGSIFLSVVAWRYLSFISSSKNCLSFELASWYWHFVDVVWIFLYFIIYYINS